MYGLNAGIQNHSNVMVYESFNFPKEMMYSFHECFRVMDVQYNINMKSLGDSEVVLPSSLYVCGTT
jgi:hypothetical protein